MAGTPKASPRPQRPNGPAAASTEAELGLEVAQAAMIGEAFGALLQTARSRAGRPNAPLGPCASMTTAEAAITGRQLEEGADEVARFQPKLLASAKEKRALEVSAPPACRAAGQVRGWGARS
jgi:hypothetical protein